MTWQSNLFNNLLVAFILLSLVVLIYCSIKKKTLIEVFKEFKEMMEVAESE